MVNSTTVTGVPGYSSLAAVYDRWMGKAPYDRVLGFLDRRIAGGLVGAVVIDLCCGTGSLALLLAERGARVVGIDASPEMLAIAEARAAAAEVVPRPVFRRGDTASVSLAGEEADLVLCTLDSLNYFPPEAFATLARIAHGAVCPGGLFIGDVNTPFKLGKVFGNSTYNEDHGDYAYTWHNRLGEGWIDFEIHLRRSQGPDQAPIETVERHRQYLHDPADLARRLTEAGFAAPEMVDDYGDAPAQPETERITLVAVRPA